MYVVYRRNNFDNKKPHSSTWKTCPHCVVELPVDTTGDPPSTSNNSHPQAINPQVINEVPVITVEIVNPDTIETNDSEIIDSTSQVHLLTCRDKPNIEIH